MPWSSSAARTMISFVFVQLQGIFIQGDALAPMKFAAAFTPAIDSAVRETKHWADELTCFSTSRSPTRFWTPPTA
eukprot:13253990-Heterocapsa_arctica.AAC.1